MLKEQDVKQYLNEKNIAFQENASIIGVLFPNKVTYAFGPVAAALSMQYFAMNFNDSGAARHGRSHASEPGLIIRF